MRSPESGQTQGYRRSRNLELETEPTSSSGLKPALKHNRPAESRAEVLSSMISQLQAEKEANLCVKMPSRNLSPTCSVSSGRNSAYKYQYSNSSRQSPSSSPASSNCSSPVRTRRCSVWSEAPESGFGKGERCIRVESTPDFAMYKSVHVNLDPNQSMKLPSTASALAKPTGYGMRRPSMVCHGKRVSPPPSPSAQLARRPWAGTRPTLDKPLYNYSGPTITAPPSPLSQSCSSDKKNLSETMTPEASSKLVETIGPAKDKSRSVVFLGFHKLDRIDIVVGGILALSLLLTLLGLTISVPNQVRSHRANSEIGVSFWDSSFRALEMLNYLEREFVPW